MRSASSITPRARRSFTEPSGLKASTFTKRFTPGGASLLIFTTGVLPTVSRMLPNLRRIGPLSGCTWAAGWAAVASRFVHFGASGVASSETRSVVSSLVVRKRSTNGPSAPRYRARGEAPEFCSLPWNYR